MDDDNPSEVEAPSASAECTIENTHAIKYLIKLSNAAFYVHYISYITYFDDMFRESCSHQ
jgi:hypothetical protein